MISLHPKAESTYNDRFESFLELIVCKANHSKAREAFEPNLYVSAKISSHELLNEAIMRSMTPFGDVLSISFRTPAGGFVTIPESDFKDVIKTIQTIANIPSIRAVAHFDEIRDISFEWIRGSHTKSVDKRYCCFLKERLEEAVKEFTVLLPMSNISIESSICFGELEIVSIGEEYFRKWGDACTPNIMSPEQKEMFILEQRKKMQGIAGIEVAVTATASQAEAIAKQKAAHAVAFLSLFSRGAFVPSLPTVFSLQGEEHVRQSSAVISGEDHLSFVSDAFSDDTHGWRLGNSSIRDIRASHLDLYARICFSEGRTKLEERLVNALTIFSHGVRQKTTEEKLVYIFTSLESLLLRNESEPIQQNVGERFSYIVAHTAESRMETLKVFKYCYSLRSSFIHHSKNDINLKKVETFLQHCHFFYLSMISLTEKFGSPEELLDGINLIKFS